MQEPTEPRNWIYPVVLALAAALMLVVVSLAFVAFGRAMDSTLSPMPPFWTAVAVLLLALYLLLRGLSSRGKPRTVACLLLGLAVPLVAFLVWLGVEGIY